MRVQFNKSVQEFKNVSACACTLCLACSLWINKWFVYIAKWWVRISILIAMEYSDEITQAESNNNASCIPEANIEFKIDYHDVIIAPRSWMESVTNLKINLMKLNKWLLRYVCGTRCHSLCFALLFVFISSSRHFGATFEESVTQHFAPSTYQIYHTFRKLAWICLPNYYLLKHTI